MKIRTIAAAAALAVSLPAFALTTDLGVIDGETNGFGNFFASGAGFFSDTFTFTLTSDQTISGMTGWSGIGSFGLAVLDSNLMVVDTDSTPESFSWMLSAGTYALNFVGFNAGAGSFYGGQVTAVPEPETYALMLAGLGMVGFMAARRSRG